MSQELAGAPASPAAPDGSGKTPRLPKQWLHWARSAGLRPAERLRGRFKGFHMKGRDRRWRVDCHGVFEASCPLEHFDRWANSRGARAPSIPKTRAEFLETVEKLRSESADAK